MVGHIQGNKKTVRAAGVTLGDAVVAAGGSRRGASKINDSPPSRLQMHAEGGLGSKAAPSLPLWFPPFGIPLLGGGKDGGCPEGGNIRGRGRLACRFSLFRNIC